MPPILNAQGVSKRFGATPLFQDIAFPVSDGDRIGLIGPNGAGKSTLLAVLAGEMEPDTGEVVTRKRGRVGYVKQVSEFAEGETCARGAGASAGALRMFPRASVSRSCARRWAGPGSRTWMSSRTR